MKITKKILLLLTIPLTLAVNPAQAKGKKKHKKKPIATNQNLPGPSSIKMPPTSYKECLDLAKIALSLDIHDQLAENTVELTLAMKIAEEKQSSRSKAEHSLQESNHAKIIKLPINTNKTWTTIEPVSPVLISLMNQVQQKLESDSMFFNIDHLSKFELTQFLDTIKENYNPQHPEIEQYAIAIKGLYKSEHDNEKQLEKLASETYSKVRSLTILRDSIDPDKPNNALCSILSTINDKTITTQTIFNELIKALLDTYSAIIKNKKQQSYSEEIKILETIKPYIDSYKKRKPNDETLYQAIISTIKTTRVKIKDSDPNKSYFNNLRDSLYEKKKETVENSYMGDIEKSFSPSQIKHSLNKKNETQLSKPPRNDGRPACRYKQERPTEDVNVFADQPKLATTSTAPEVAPAQIAEIYYPLTLDLLETADGSKIDEENQFYIKIRNQWADYYFYKPLNRKKSVTPKKKFELNTRVIEAFSQHQSAISYEKNIPLAADWLVEDLSISRVFTHKETGEKIRNQCIPGKIIPINGTDPVIDCVFAWAFDKYGNCYHRCGDKKKSAIQLLTECKEQKFEVDFPPLPKGD